MLSHKDPIASLLNEAPRSCEPAETVPLTTFLEHTRLVLV